MNLELYHHSESVCAQKVRLALAEKKVDWVSHYVDLEKGEQRLPEFYRINPVGAIPVLIHNQKVIPESTVICEYVDECFDGPSLMTQDPYVRSRIRLWSKTVDEGLHYPNTFIISFIIAFRHMSKGHIKTPEQIAEYLDGIQNPKIRKIHEQIFYNGINSQIFGEAIRFYDDVLEKMELTLREQSWLAGEDFSFADLALAPYIHRLNDLQLIVMCERRPAVLNWYKRLKSRPSWQTAIVDWNDQKYVVAMQKNGKRVQAETEKVWRTLQ